MKKKMLLLCMAGLLCFASPAGAVPFPEKSDEVVQDNDDYLSKEAKSHFTEFTKQFTDATYKLVVVESTQPEAQTPDEYAQKLYDNYNLNENTMMIVLDINSQQIGVYPGKALVEKGAKLEMLHEKIVSFYDPYRNQKEYAKGIEMFITETNNELARIAAQAAPAGKTAPAAPATTTQTTADDNKPFWLSLPWWLYLIGFLFVGMLGLLIYSFIRRRQVFSAVDRVEDWKDQLVEKLQMIEVDKSLRRSSGSTEERYVQLANRKEHILRVRVPDVEMIILEAEEACDRFRFQMATGLLEEAEELLEQIENEMSELKSDMTKVVQTKKESKAVLPEIGKLFESVGRKLDHARLEYGLSFHELKAKHDEAERLRASVKSAQASGDDVQAYETTMKAQAILTELAEGLEKIPALVKTIQFEMPEEFKEMEEGIAAVLSDGYDLSETALDAAMLQARQLLTAAKTSLEEGNLETAATHAKAFRVKLDATFAGIEEAVLKQRETAAQLVETADISGIEAAPTPPEEQVEEYDRERAAEELAWAGVAEAAPAADPVITPNAPVMGTESPVPPAQGIQSAMIAEEMVEELQEEEEYVAPATKKVEIPVDDRTDQWAKRKREYEEQMRLQQMSLQVEPDDLYEPEEAIQPEEVYESVGVHQSEEVYEQEEMHESEEEYELVIPRRQPIEEEPQSINNLPVIETEDDVLDELERISGVLVKVRQQIKRSYLPGIPDQLKYHFEQSVQLLATIKSTMEQYRYELEEVVALLEEVNEFVMETETLTEKVIANCQLAEGAIQYTNRYRRQNREVNELLQKAEQAFRQLSFQEAYQLAEEARLLVEGEPEETESRWILRKKKKG